MCESNRLCRGGGKTAHWCYFDYFESGKKVERRFPIYDNPKTIWNHEQIQSEYLNTFTISFDDLDAFFSSSKSWNETVFYRKQGGHLWQYLLERRLIEKYNIRFFEDVKFGEDLLFITEYLMHCEKLIVMEDSLVFYRQHSTSAMHTVRSVADKLISLVAKERMLELISESERQWYRDKWQAQTILIVINGARVHGFSEYMKLCRNQSVQAAVTKLKQYKFKSVPMKYKMAFALVKKKMFWLLWFAINLLKKLRIGISP